MNPDLFQFRFRFFQVPIWIPAALFLSLRSVKKYLQPSGISLSLHLFTLCLHWRLSFRYSPPRLWFNPANMDWLWFYSVACWSFEAADRVSAQRASCFLRQLSEVTRSGCVVHTIELIRARDQGDFKSGSCPRLSTLLLFVFKVMAERGARLLLSLFCLTITLSHADKGKSEIKEH